MSNIGYCRFENTYQDLLECKEALHEEGITYLLENSNQYEKPYIKKLIELCTEISENFSEEIEDLSN